MSCRNSYNYFTDAGPLIQVEILSLPCHVIEILLDQSVFKEEEFSILRSCDMMQFQSKHVSGCVLAQALGQSSASQEHLHVTSCLRMYQINVK